MATVNPNTSKARELIELAGRVEAASGHDLDLDHEIGRTLSKDGNYSYRPYTASLDAALSLIPDNAGLDAAGERFRLESWTTNGVHAPHVRATAWVAGARRVYAATPALALCAAALRSLALMGEEKA